MLETQRYTRKPFDIDAVRVTADNITEVAQWVDGDIRTDDVGQYIKVRVHRPASERQTKAYIGDWVLYAGTGYKCYTPAAFNKSFDKISDETVLIDPAARRTPVEQGEVVGEIQGDVVVPKRVAKKAAKAGAKTA